MRVGTWAAPALEESCSASWHADHQLLVSTCDRLARTLAPAKSNARCEERVCEAAKRKQLICTIKFHFLHLAGLQQHTGWLSCNCHNLMLSISHLLEFKKHACTFSFLAIVIFGDHLRCCTQRAGGTQ